MKKQQTPLFIVYIVVMVMVTFALVNFAEFYKIILMVFDGGKNEVGNKITSALLVSGILWCIPIIPYKIATYIEHKYIRQVVKWEWKKDERFDEYERAEKSVPFAVVLFVGPFLGIASVYFFFSALIIALKENSEQAVDKALNRGIL